MVSQVRDVLAQASESRLEEVRASLETSAMEREACASSRCVALDVTCQDLHGSMSELRAASEATARSLYSCTLDCKGLAAQLSCQREQFGRKLFDLQASLNSG